MSTEVSLSQNRPPMKPQCSRLSC